MSNLSSEERADLIRQIVEAEELERTAKGNWHKKRFYEFNQNIMGWPDLYEPLHRKVCEFIQDNIKDKKILLLLPRGCFKSTIVTVSYALWQIAKNPNSRGLIANSTYPMAVSFLSQIKDTLRSNEEFIRLYGDLATDAPVWREDSIQVNSRFLKDKKSKEPTLTATGVRSNYTGKHFDYAILDDLVNRDNIGTLERIEQVKNFYKDVLDLVDPNVDGHKPVIVVGTTWHQADLYSWIQDPDVGVMNDFAIMKLPAYGGFDSEDRFDGEWGKGDLLFPKRLTWDVMESLKNSQGMSHFSAQYLLDPVPSENAVFRKFKYYEPSDIKGLKLTKFVAVDPAMSEKKEADYSAMVCVGVDYENNWYILDIWRDKVNPKRLLDQIFYWDTKYKPYTTAVETVAFQKVLRFYLNDEMRKRNQFIPIKELKHTDRSKEDRIRGLEPRYETGTIFHLKSDPLTKYLEDELKRFPKGKNDDLADALASILEISFPSKRLEHRGHARRGSNYPA